ncbi:uncharacterized protein LOC110998134 [Pieris rapae]|uniref:uncharacterized protein LOC110998134 n=1 Tax=Pieris rapae TaxID=64459 RepID=UPI001E27C7DE|nr:uncharacterized protein LOC110998134 [Pieris rapae]
MKLRASNEGSMTSTLPTPPNFRSLMSQQSESNRSQSANSGLDTMLLNMVRSQSKEIRDEVQDITPALPSENLLQEPFNEPCIHGLSLRMTDRSVSRSRFSRISTRRDMDIPSILAFSASDETPAPVEIPAFQKPAAPKKEERPKWSIRRSVCPVCSQKWRDRSALKNIRASGLKRNLTNDLPSVIAPARLRTAATLGYTPRPIPPAEDKDIGLILGSFKTSANSWQFTRARKFRIPKPRQPPPESLAPISSTAPTAKKDLDLRVDRFLATQC